MTARTPPAPWHPERLLPPRRDASDRPLLWSALALAGLLHLGALCLPLPPPPAVELPETPRRPPIRVDVWEIPAPSIPEPELPPAGPIVRRVPVPAPEAPVAEPLSEPPRPPDTPVAIEDPPLWVAPRPAPQPAPAGPVDENTPGVERPVPLPGRAEPVYPRGPLLARLDGRVVLRAVITERGDVESIEVVLEDPPGLGFGAAAYDAVSTWRYRPGRLDGRPVAVVLTVVVEFKLR